MSNHPIVHIEISTLDRLASGKFYENLFGWPIQQMEEMNYAMAETNGDQLGLGISPVSASFPAGSVTFYVGTDDIEASLAKAQSLGAKLIPPKTEIPGMGWFGLFQDPSGNIIGLFTSLMPAS